MTTKTMLRRMEAEILFNDPDDVSLGIAALFEHDFEVEVLPDRIDDYGPTVWINAKVVSELDDSCFFDWVQSIVEPLGGDVYEAGDCQAVAPQWA